MSIAAGAGIGLENSGGVLTPGYIIKTADAWESLLYRAVRAGLPGCSVNKVKRPLGISRRLFGNDMDDPLNATGISETVWVNPDILIEKPPVAPLLVDAKYRTSPARTLGKLRVEANDLYEMLAFLSAAGAQRGVLIYPLPTEDEISAKTGKSRIFEKLEIGGNLIFGLAIDVRGISASNGFKQFASVLCEALQICWTE